MHTEETQDKFMELRAQGWTLGHIGTELHVSKRTLVEWNKHFAADIQALRVMELELLKEKIIASREEEISRLARLRKDVDDELSNRTLKFIPIEKLFRLSVELRQEMEHAGLEKHSSGESSTPSLNGHARSVAPANNGG